MLFHLTVIQDYLPHIEFIFLYIKMFYKYLETSDLVITKKFFFNPF